MTQPFFQRLDLLDSVIARGPQECDFDLDVEPLLAEDSSRSYFYESLKDPGWLIVLSQAGKFRSVPEPILDPSGKGYFHPPWSESRYLVGVAEQMPQLTKEIVLRIPDTENIRVHEDLVDVAINLPVDMAAELGRNEAHWIGSQRNPGFFLPDTLAELISHLARGGEVETGVDVARALLAILPDPTSTVREADDDSYRPLPRPCARFSSWDYERVLQKFVREVVPLAGESALAVLCSLLSDAIRLSHNSTEDGSREDYSYVWRSTIEGADSDRNDDLENLLVSAVRDAAEALMEKNPIGTLTFVEAQNYRVFGRIGLHLRRKWPESDSEGTARLVTDREVIEDIDVNHELFCILQQQFGKLPMQAQRDYLTLIEQGIDPQSWLDFRERESGQRPSEEEATKYIQRWQYRKLIPVSEFLDQEWTSRFLALKNQLGEWEHPDLLSFTSGLWRGPTSPKSEDELQVMSVESLVSYLRDWQPPSDPIGPSSEGLGRTLTSLVAAEPTNFAAKAELFNRVAPTYVGALLAGFNGALKNKRDFSWRSVVDLCKWVAVQPEIPDNADARNLADPGWGWTRKQIADLIQSGFQAGTLEIPYDFRYDVWEILRILTQDPDPTPEREQALDGETMDPATLSINTTRGESMHAVVRYALWVRRHDRDPVSEAGDQAHDFDDMPEVRSVLEHHLDPGIDPSLAIRSVYGQWFPWLVLLDEDWASRHANVIFPEFVDSQALAAAAWETYLRFCAGYDNVFKLLRDQYSQAVERINATSAGEKGHGAPDERLIEHLMVFFWRELLALDERRGLLTRFYSRAPESLKAHAIDFLGRNLHNNDEVPLPVLDRLKALFEERVEVVRRGTSSKTPASELVPFGWWFASGKFEVVWALGQLRNVLTISGWAEPHKRVIERLAEVASQWPAESVECLGLLVDGDKDGWHTRMWDPQTRDILSSAFESSDPTGRQRAEDLVHRLGSLGYFQYRDLLRYV